MKKEITLYKNKYFFPIQSKYLQRKYNWLLSDEGKKRLSAFAEYLSDYIMNAPAKISLLKLSPLYTSLVVPYAENKICPRFSLTFYSEDDEPFYTSYADAAWLFSDWQEYRDSIFIDDPDFRQHIHRQETEAFSLSTLYPLTLLLSAALRYELKKYITKLTNITDDFMIILGMYEKEGEPVLIVRKQENLNAVNAVDDLTCTAFQGYSCCNNDFSGKKFCMSVFQQCRFENCDFSAADLRDADFQNCGFFNCCFDNSIINGIGFQNCFFDAVTMEKPQIIVSADNLYRQAFGKGNSFVGKIMAENTIKWQNSKFVDYLSEREMVWNISD